MMMFRAHIINVKIRGYIYISKMYHVGLKKYQQAYRLMFIQQKHGYTIFSLYSKVHIFDHFSPAGYHLNTHNTDMKNIIYDFNHCEISRLQRVREYNKNCIVLSAI